MKVIPGSCGMRLRSRVPCNMMSIILRCLRVSGAAARRRGVGGFAPLCIARGIALRYTAQHRDEARVRIVAAAARAIRERGLAEATIADIMGRAGLTHGAFYHHFADRDALLAEAISAATVDTRERVFADGVDAASMLDMYCSLDHAAAPGEGCVLAALGTEAAHQEASPVKAAFATAARGFIEHVARALRPAARGSRRDPGAGPHAAIPRRLDDEALALAARMIGAVVLARLVDDRRLAARILAAARQ